jgi:7-cyano-7-deazaguanine reductase
MNLTQTESNLLDAPLGKKSPYVNTYTPSLLFPVPRKLKRDEIGIQSLLPFTGFDIWNGFELSWLNSKGKPIVSTAEFCFPCESPNIVESKSFKLYLNSFNNSRFESFDQVQTILEGDLSGCTESKVSVKLFQLDEGSHLIGKLSGKCLDDLDVEVSNYQPNPSFLSTQDNLVEETVYTNLLKSNCLVTGQPDWGTIQISYKGQQINHEGLLKYIVSLRDHNEFHEQCVERVYFDLLNICRPEFLSVYARYTRRGGLDINPYRVSPGFVAKIENTRLIRQ